MQRRRAQHTNAELKSAEEILKAIARENEMTDTVQRSVAEWSSIVENINSGSAPVVDDEWKTK